MRQGSTLQEGNDMAIRSSTNASRLPGTRSQPKAALATAISLLLMALLAPFAQPTRSPASSEAFS
jgi:hypothetical protein